MSPLGAALVYLRTVDPDIVFTEDQRDILKWVADLLETTTRERDAAVYDLEDMLKNCSDLCRSCANDPRNGGRCYKDKEIICADGRWRGINGHEKAEIS